MALPPAKPGTTIPLEIPPDIHPVYSNLARISHGPGEFIIDFARFLPGDVKATVTARVVMSPVAFKLFLQAANENLARFETNIGAITLPRGGSSLADHLFRPFNGPPPKSPDKKDE